MSTALMAPRKKRNTKGAAIAQEILKQYQPQTKEDMQEAIKYIFGPMFEAMLQGEMDSHLGYEANDHGYKDTDNRRNGYISKNVKTSYGEIPVDVPRDRQATFEPQVIPKRTRDVSGIEDKVMSMYARGMSQRDIADTIEDIYGFEISHETISSITDRVIETAEEWQNRPLKKFYTFLFVDCLYVSIRKEMETKSCAVYVILGYDVNGIKDILGILIGEAEGKHYWMQIFDEIKARGVEDVLFISMDGVSGLEEGARSIFKDVTVQRCIVHLIRNSVKYIPSKDYKAYTAQLKKVYGAASLHDWVAKGRSPYDNGDYICGAGGFPLDFISALRAEKELQDWFDSLSEEEKEAEKQGLCYQYSTETDEVCFDMNTFQLPDVEECDLPFE